jgi:hypothetical protein
MLRKFARESNAITYYMTAEKATVMAPQKRKMIYRNVRVGQREEKCRMGNRIDRPDRGVGGT